MFKAPSTNSEDHYDYCHSNDINCLASYPLGAEADDPPRDCDCDELTTSSCKAGLSTGWLLGPSVPAGLCHQGVPASLFFVFSR